MILNAVALDAFEHLLDVDELAGAIQAGIGLVDAEGEFLDQVPNTGLAEHGGLVFGLQRGYGCSRLLIVFFNNRVPVMHKLPGSPFLGGNEFPICQRAGSGSAQR